MIHQMSESTYEPQFSSRIEVRTYGMMYMKVLLNFKTTHGDNIMLLIIIIIRLLCPVRITTIISVNISMRYPMKGSVY